MSATWRLPLPEQHLTRLALLCPFPVCRRPRVPAPQPLPVAGLHVSGWHGGGSRCRLAGVCQEGVLPPRPLPASCSPESQLWGMIAHVGSACHGSHGAAPLHPALQGAWGAGLLRTLAVILATRAYQMCEHGSTQRHNVRQCALPCHAMP